MFSMLKAGGTMKPVRTCVLYALTVLNFLLIAGCSVTPPKSTFEKAIGTYFQERNLRVVSMDIAEIQDIPLGEKQYMGTPGYVVTVASLVLEDRGGAGSLPQEGKEKELSYTDVQIRLKQRSLNSEEWVITDIKGM